MIKKVDKSAIQQNTAMDGHCINSMVPEDELSCTQMAYERSKTEKRQ